MAEGAHPNRCEDLQIISARCCLVKWIIIPAEESKNLKNEKKGTSCGPSLESMCQSSSLSSISGSYALTDEPLLAVKDELRIERPEAMVEVARLLVAVDRNFREVPVSDGIDDAIHGGYFVVASGAHDREDQDLVGPGTRKPRAVPKPIVGARGERPSRSAE